MNFHNIYKRVNNESLSTNEIIEAFEVVSLLEAEITQNLYGGF